MKSNYAYFPIAIDENGIYARKYFYPFINAFDCYCNKYNTDCTPIALHISENILILLLYADLSFDNVDKICDILIK